MPKSFLQYLKEEEQQGDPVWLVVQSQKHLGWQW